MKYFLLQVTNNDVDAMAPDDAKGVDTRGVSQRAREAKEWKFAVGGPEDLDITCAVAATGVGDTAS